MPYGRQLLAWLAAGSLALAGCLLSPTSDLGSEIPGGSSSGGGSNGGSSSVGGVTATNSELPVANLAGCTEPFPGDAWRARVLELTNIERNSRGIGAVQRDATLEAQADRYACEMIFYDFFGHENEATGSTLQDRAEQFGYDYFKIGENLAAGHRTPEEVVQAWMDSPGHRENLLDPEFTELGVGLSSGGEYGTYWVQEFGWPRH